VGSVVNDYHFRVRGGQSQSFFTFAANDQSAIFSGNLDISTLGGAGFASQRTEIAQTKLAFTTVRLEVVPGDFSDDKTYALNLYPSLGNDPNASNLEYKFLFRVTKGDAVINIKREDFKAYYRGRPVTDKPQEIGSEVQAVSVMCASLFGKQSGTFTLQLRSIVFY
jgi:hypothetical protein